MWIAPSKSKSGSPEITKVTDFKQAVKDWEEKIRIKWQKSSQLRLDLQNAEQDLDSAVLEATEAGITISEISHLLCEPPQKTRRRLR